MKPSQNAWGDLLDDPAGYWQREAENARNIGRIATDREVRSTMFAAAADYDRFAVQALSRSKRTWSTLRCVCTRWWVRLRFG